MSSIAADWGRIAEEHAARIFRAARAAAPDDDAAWDCVQEAFLTALTADSAPEKPVDWLCGVARNHARHAVRGRGRFRRFLGRLALRRRPDPGRPPSAARLDLDEALGRLPPKLRDAVVLRHLARMSPAEVARAQRISEGAARVRVHRGLARLRRILGPSALLLLLVRRAAAAPAHPLAPVAGAVAAVAPAVGLTLGVKAAVLAGVLATAGGIVLAARGLTVDPPATPGTDVRTPAAAVTPGLRPSAAVLASEDSPAPSGRVRGRILDPDGRPIADARLSLATAGGQPTTNPRLAASARSDDDGRFVLEGVPRSTDLVVVGSALPWLRSVSGPFRIDADGERDDLVVRMRRGAIVSGRVVDADGEPVGGARVRGVVGRSDWWIGENLPALLPEETVTRADGTYRLAGLEARTHAIRVEKRGHVTARLEDVLPTFDGATAPDIVLPHGVFLRGTVVDDAGEPVAGVTIAIEGGQARASGTDGRFEVLAPRPGRYRISVRSTDHVPVAPFESDLPRPEPLRIVLERGESISGTVLLADGTPAPPGVVRAVGPGGVDKLAGFREAGRFVVRGLPPGDYTLTALTAPRVFRHVVGVPVGAEDVVIREAADRAIAGVVVSPDGAPVAGARVLVRPVVDGKDRITRIEEAERTRPRSTITTGKNGRFETDDLPGDRYEITARHRSFLPATVSPVPAGSDAVTVVLADGLSVSGRIETEGPLPARVRVTATGDGMEERRASMGEDGSFDVGPFPPGRVDLVVSSADGVWHEVRGVETGAAGLRIRVLVPRDFEELRENKPRRLPDRPWAKLWAMATARGATEEADLVAILPEIAVRLRAEEGSALAAFHVLVRIGSPAAVRALAPLLRDDRIATSDDAPSIAPELLDLADQELPGAAVAMFRRSVAAGDTSWVHMHPICALLARQGGDEAVQILTAALLRREPSGQTASGAVKALAHASDPRLLAAGLSAIGIEIPPTPAEYVADALIEGFGEQARAAFRRWIEDPETSRERRLVAVAALARQGTAADVDRLLERDEGADEGADAGGWWCALARELPRRKDGVLAGARLARLTGAVGALLVHADPGVRLRALQAVRSGAAFHTSEMAAQLQALRETGLHSAHHLDQALERIRKTLGGK